MKCVVFVCHNQATIDRVKHHLMHDHVYVLLVGMHADPPTHPRIVTACQLPHHIEAEHQLLTFTAWYAIVKNKLWDEYESYCILEYDCIVRDMPKFHHDLNARTEKVVCFFTDRNNFFVDVNPTCFNAFLKSKHITTVFQRDHLWGSSTNQCINKELLNEFVDWYFPYCLYFKVWDYYNYSFYHERLFAVFLLQRGIPLTIFTDEKMVHEEVRSHCITRHLPVSDFDWSYYLQHNPDILQGRINLPQEELRRTSIAHFIQHGYGEKRHYKPNPKHYFLVYDDETGKYDLETLLQSVRTHSSFEIVVFKKSEMAPAFLEQYKDIFALERGGGYWLWKPYIIKTMLERIEEGSLLFYMDSSYTFIKKFETFLNYADTHDVLVWKNKPKGSVYPMKQWCKRDVMDHYLDSAQDGNMEVCWAGAMLLKNTLYTRSMVDKWFTMCCNAHHLTDSPSVNPNSSDFIEHRHDQTMLTIALFLYMVPLHFFGTDILKNNRDP
jgi:hypothetical protein